MVKVVIADDEEFVRYFLKSVIESLSYDVVAEVEKGDELVKTLQDYKPDILLLDINMPNMTGLEFLKEHASKFPNTCIIILTSASSLKLISQTTQDGAKCFLRKDTPINDMIYAIKQTWLEFKGINQ